MPTYIHLRLFICLDKYFLECKIKTISPGANINQERKLDEYLKFVADAQILYWNLIG